MYLPQWLKGLINFLENKNQMIYHAYNLDRETISYKINKGTNKKINKRINISWGKK
jgi:hypothetical protein